VCVNEKPTNALIIECIGTLLCYMFRHFKMPSSGSQTWSCWDRCPMSWEAKKCLNIKNSRMHLNNIENVHWWSHIANSYGGYKQKYMLFICILLYLIKFFSFPRHWAPISAGSCFNPWWWHFKVPKHVGEYWVPIHWMINAFVGFSFTLKISWFKIQH
jgi:hypothetical protein